MRSNLEFYIIDMPDHSLLHERYSLLGSMMHSYWNFQPSGGSDFRLYDHTGQCKRTDGIERK